MRILVNKTTNEVLLVGDFEIEKRSDSTIVLQSGVQIFALFHIAPDNLETVEVNESDLPEGYANSTLAYSNGVITATPKPEEVPRQELQLQPPSQVDCDAERRKIYTETPVVATPPRVTAEVSIAPGEYVAVPTIPVRMIPMTVHKGLKLIGKPTESLTTEERGWQKDAVNWELKERLRGLIEVGVGDALDQLANTDKQLQLITGLTVRMYRLLRLIADSAITNDLISQEEFDAVVPPDVKAGYDNYADGYAEAVSNGTYKDRVDVDDAGTVISHVMASAGMLGLLVKTEFIDKKVS